MFRNNLDLDKLYTVDIFKLQSHEDKPLVLGSGCFLLGCVPSPSHGPSPSPSHPSQFLMSYVICLVSYVCKR